MNSPIKTTYIYILAFLMARNKYILIISEESEKSTDEVLKYLLVFGAKYARIIDSDRIGNVKISIDETSSRFQFESNGKKICLSEVQSVWYRRGRMTIASGNITEELTEKELDLYRTC